MSRIVGLFYLANKTYVVYIYIIVFFFRLCNFCNCWVLFCHVMRVYIFNYSMYSADFTWPLTIITQKITSLAFEIHNGMAKQEGLTPSQKYLSISSMPSLLEYLSYNCNFMGILAGPTCSYNDYMAIIEGTGYRPRHQEKANGKENGKSVRRRRICPQPFPLQNVNLYVAMLALRPKYYFVGTRADAINNAAGFGFNGYNKDGSLRWDLISNLRILDIEFPTSFKLFLDNWNIQTPQWLKRVCYERCPINSTVATFLLTWTLRQKEVFLNL
uniref:Uncharacterized protein n=1 Tax=Gouania willdenowi TaxID=441366 RepID=A0A8C5G7S4_GOUWI